MKKIIAATAFAFSMFAALSFGQTNFPERVLGVWEGKMLIYNNGVIKDTVQVKFTVARTKTDGDYTWKMEYFSPTRPMTKDYILRVKDAAKGIYVTDEGGGVELYDHNHGDKLYSVFETGGVLLTASYELRGKELIFEVTSGRAQGEAKNGITNYSVPNVQRVVLKKIKK